MSPALKIYFEIEKRLESLFVEMGGRSEDGSGVNNCSCCCIRGTGHPSSAPIFYEKLTSLVESFGLNILDVVELYQETVTISSTLRVEDGKLKGNFWRDQFLATIAEFL